MIKMNLILLALSILLLTAIIETSRTQKKYTINNPKPPKCNCRIIRHLRPIIPPVTTIDCHNGLATIDGVSYTDCANCIQGTTDTSLNNNLNTALIFTTGGWTFGAKVLPSASTQASGLLQLTWDAINGYHFDLVTNFKYEVVIAIQGVNCYTTYLFPCLTLDGTNKLLFDTLGLDNGTLSQTVLSITYYYRAGSCGFCVSNPTFPKENGQIDCSNFGTVTSNTSGPYKACWGTYSGNLDDGKSCSTQNGICLKEVLNGSPLVCNIQWCFLEKLEVGGNNVTGNFWSITVNSGTDGRIGNYILNWVNTQPYIITLKAANFYSAYILQSGISGFWNSFNNGLSHASLWVPCTGMPLLVSPAFLQLDSK